jgi:hypothetical protein
MNEMEAGQLKKWLEDNGARMQAYVAPGGLYVVVIHKEGSAFAGVGESLDYEEAIRMAQHFFDLGVIAQARRSARVVGQA